MSIPFKILIKENRIIRGDFFPSTEDPKGILIICHGFKGFKDWGMFPYVAQNLAKQIHVITFNFSYNGVGEDKFEFTELEKFAQNTYSKEFEDLEILIHHIQNKSLSIDYPLSDLPLFLLGHSRGAGVSLIYAFDHPQQITGVISWNGITNVDLFSNDIKKEMRSIGRAYIFNARTKQQMPLNLEILEDIEVNQVRFNILERVRSSSIPIILIQGTKDFEHLQAGSSQLTANNPAIQLIQIPEGNHTFGTVHPFQQETEPLKKALYHTEEFLSSILQRS